MKNISAICQPFLKLLFFLACLSTQSRLQAQAVPKATPDSNFVNHLLDSAYSLESTDSEKALKVYRQAKQVSQKIDYALGQAKALHYSGIVYSDKSRYKEALSMYAQALRLYKAINNTRGTGACYVNLGNLYHFQSKLDSALLYYQRSVSIFKENSHLNALSQSYGNIGIIFQKMGQLQKAYNYQVLAAKLARQVNDSTVLTRALINQGAVLYELKKYEQSFKVNEQALKIAEKIDDQYDLQVTHINAADYYKQKKNYQEAIRYGLLSLKYALQLSTPYDIADIKRRLGDLYVLSGNYLTAERYYQEAIELSEKVNAKEISENIYTSLHKLYAKLKQYDKAYKYQSLAQEYGEKIFGEKQFKTINELEVKYQTAQKEKAITQQRLQIAQNEVQLQKSKRFAMFSVAAAFIAILLTTILILYYRNKRRLDRQRLQSLQQEKEIHVLHALMQGEEKERTRIARDLHDEVAGMLAAAKMQMDALALQAKEIIQCKGYKQVVGLLDDASVSVRKTAHNLMPEVLKQHGLDIALRRYCNNISSTKLEVQYDSWGEIGRFADNFELSVYRIVQELLNNIVKHSGASQAIVQLSCNENMLSLTVEDNGTGFIQGNESNGMGLLALRTRVEALQGTMEVTSQEGNGVSVYLEFDVAPMGVEAD